jgi:hypothetical protein
MSNFAVIRHYHFDAKDSQLIDKNIKENFLPLIKNCKGFVKYYWLDGGNGEGASVSIFETKAEGEESNNVAKEFVSKYLKDVINQKPEIIEGLIVAHD